MIELKKIILNHSRKYPLMQPVDYIKLLYQNEFGPGHLVRDGSMTLNWIMKEYEENTFVPAECLEDIGNGMVRVYLRLLQRSQLSGLNDAFVESAAEVKGSRDSFLAKIAMLREMAEEGSLNVTLQQLDDYLAGYDYSMVSHSEVFRNSYQPAYRVVLLQKAREKLALHD